MARLEFKLQDGLKLLDDEGKQDGPPMVDVVMSDPGAAEILAASEEAEKCVYAPDNSPVMVHSPARMASELLGRQIVSIGDIKGPISRSLLGKLSAIDLLILQAKGAELDAAVDAALIKAFDKRGRDDPDGEDSG